MPQPFFEPPGGEVLRGGLKDTGVKRICEYWAEHLLSAAIARLSLLIGPVLQQPLVSIIRTPVHRSLIGNTKLQNGVEILEPRSRFHMSTMRFMLSAKGDVSMAKRLEKLVRADHRRLPFTSGTDKQAPSP
jgi:hypothetical protein